MMQPQPKRFREPSPLTLVWVPCCKGIHGLDTNTPPSMHLPASTVIECLKCARRFTLPNAYFIP